MRLAVPLLLLAGCTLYFGDDDGQDDGVPPLPDGGVGTLAPCRGVGVNDPVAAPGTVRRASRVATSGNEFAWGMARTTDNATFIVGELEGGQQGLISCVLADGTVAWTEFDSTVLRWRAIVPDTDGTPVMVGDLRTGGSVVRRLADQNRAGWSINFASQTGSANITAITSVFGGLGVVVVGNFTGTLTVGGQTLTSAGGTDGLFARLDVGFGDVIETRTFGGNGDDGATDLASRGDVLVVSGHSRSDSFTMGNQLLAPAGADDALVFETTVSANTIPWARRFGTAGDERGAAVAIDEGDNVYVMTDHAIVAHDTLGQELWVTALDSPVVSSLWDLVAGGGKVYTAGMYFTPGTLGGVALPDPSSAPRFVAELAADSGAPGWLVAGEGPTIDATMELGPNLIVGGTYLVNFEMGGVRLDPATPHDIYAMEIAR